MAKKKYKLGWGDESKISSAISSGLLDGGDLVVTKDTKRIAFIDPSTESIHFLKSKLLSFDSVQDAKDYAASDKSAYVGELITVLVGGKQKTYRLQAAESGYTIEDIESGTSGSKQYVQVSDAFPTSGQEEGVIYIVGSVGKIWTGSEWKVIFEDISSIEEKLDKKANVENPDFTGILSVNGEEVALKSYVEKLVAGVSSFTTGKVNLTDGLPLTGYKAGQIWYITEDGTYAGQKCESGDLIICVNDCKDAYSDDDFIVVQGNIDGAVTGVKSSADGELVIFSGVSGKSIKNSGINVDALEDAINKAHEHANKDILDSFTKTQDEILQESEDTISAVYEEVCNRLIHTEPYAEGNYLYANGHGLTVESVDENTNKAIYYLSGQKKEITFKTGGVIIGGAKNDNCHSSSIVMNSGNVAIIHGGSYGDGDVADVNIVVNGGTLEAIYGGGMPQVKESGYANHVGHARIIVNNVSGTSQIFGGGYSYATVGTSEIIVNNGNFTYITAGGSNGYTSDSSVEVNGGTVQCVQGVNRGIVGRAKITINAGTITAVYAGVEPGGEATGSFGHTELHLNGGTIQKLSKGLNNSEDYDASTHVSGEYSANVVDAESAQALGLNLATQIVRSDVETAKTEAVDEAKKYVDSAITLIEF